MKEDVLSHGRFLGKIVRLLVDCPWVDDRVKRPYRKNDVVKCVMVSRLGDCGLTHDLKAQFGYEVRVAPAEIEIIDFADQD